MEYRDLDHLSGKTQEKRDDVRFCLACGYDLCGSPGDRCPECGDLFIAAKWRKFADRIKAQQADLTEGLGLIPVAAKLVAAAFIVRFLEFVPFIRESFLPILRPATMAVGFFALCISLNAIHVRRLPNWARQQVAIRPDSTSAVIAMAGGCLLLASGVLMY